MTPCKYRLGMLVDHPTKPEWGPGRVLAILGRNVRVYFRDFPEHGGGDEIQEIHVDHVPLIPAKSQSDPRLDNLPATITDLGPLSVRCGFLPEVIASFLQTFPLGFADPKYIGTRNLGERRYKWRAHERYRQYPWAVERASVY